MRRYLAKFYFFKTATVVLFTGLLISFGVLYKVYDDKVEIKEALVKEKESIIIDLKKSKRDLEIAIRESSGYRADLELEKEKISILLNQIGKTNVNLETILKYKKEVDRLNKVVIDLHQQKEKLIKTNEKIKSERDSTFLVLGKAQKYNDTLRAMNENIRKEIIKIGSSATISVVNLKVYPLKEGDEMKITDRANKTDKLRISFAVVGNNRVTTSLKEYYIQVIDAGNNVIGDNKSVKFGTSILYYSDILEVKFKNKTVEVDKDLFNDKFVKGTYFVNIFDKNKLVSNASFSLK